MKRGLKVVAHRGASGDAPENTLAAFRLAWQQGADGIELDLQGSVDGELVVCHDPDTARTGDRTLRIARATWPDLQAIDVGRSKGQAWAGERIPRLAEVIAELPAGRRMMVELKGGGELLRPLRDLLRGVEDADERIALLSFDPTVLQAARPLFPAHTLWLNVEAPRLGTFQNWTAERMVAQVRRCAIDGLSLGWTPRLDRPIIDQLHAAGVPVAVWTVDDAHAARNLARLGIEVLMTNRPGAMRAALREGASA